VRAASEALILEKPTAEHDRADHANLIGRLWQSASV
jgi:hypothetical protein